MKLRKLSHGIAFSGTALSLVLSGAAHAAAGTTAGTTVSNTASVAYTIGGAAQTPVASNAAAFLVDRKVNVTVAQVGGQATVVSFGETDQVIAFTVTNNTNATQDFRLVGVQQLALVATLLGHADNYAVDNFRVFVDVNGNNVYDAGDTATYIDELAPDQSKTVFIVADIPGTGPSDAIAGVVLTAIAAAGGGGGSLGSDLIATLLGDTANAIDNVFADAAGAVDLVRDGRSSALGEYNIGSTALDVNKIATTISDPINGALLPKAIPGAVVEYCIQVQNTGSGAATDIAVTDTIPDHSTYVAGSLFVNGTTLLGACNGDGNNEDDDATGADDSDTVTGSFDGSKIASKISTLAAGATRTTRFRVTLN
ncbi:DUF11 domain-containing protein [Sphingomonas sp. SRS2]|uniref:DUF11 domain-containing protein n=1 Tax=Sphingomonas sp. SRS2 TaxID=133190 RepID=UPI000A06710C|nr:DUF11 domain-containing protein [Sphingomonas sp. SRS2]